MAHLLKRLFIDHPKEVGEGYFQHMAQASHFGLRLLRLSAAAFLHGVVPGLCKSTVSQAIKDMADELNGRAPQAR